MRMGTGYSHTNFEIHPLISAAAFSTFTAFLITPLITEIISWKFRRITPSQWVVYVNFLKFFGGLFILCWSRPNHLTLVDPGHPRSLRVNWPAPKIPHKKLGGFHRGYVCPAPRSRARGQNREIWGCQFQSKLDFRLCQVWHNRQFSTVGYVRPDATVNSRLCQTWHNREILNLRLCQVWHNREFTVASGLT
jgi:hypothetical protein